MYYLLYHGSPNQHRVHVGTHKMYICIMRFCTSNNYTIDYNISYFHSKHCYYNRWTNCRNKSWSSCYCNSDSNSVCHICSIVLFKKEKIARSNRMTSQLHPTNESSTWDQSQNVVAPMKIQGNVAYYTKTPTGLYPSPPMYNDVVEVNIHS